jgi:glyoxylase-like metal-dependent hydrolase (beta-lactamase superfamily II)
VKLIQEGIHQIVSPFPEYQRKDAYELRHDLEAHPRVTKGLPYVLLYYLESRGETLLIDCGWNTDDSLLALQEQLREKGTDITEIDNLLLTHAHPDHCGLGGRLKELTDCKIWMHEAETNFIQSRYQDPEALLGKISEWLGQHGVDEKDQEELERSSMPMRFFVSPFETDNLVKGGETIDVGDFSFEVVWTPGHSPGHICLYERNHKLLLSGDHVLPQITPNVSLHPQQRENPLGDFLNSLDLVAELDVERVLPAHEWDIDWFKKRLDEMRDHHRERLGDMLEAVGTEGSATATDVAKRIEWTTGSYDSFPTFMRRAAIGEALSHLVYLASQGELKQFDDNGVVRFQRE